MQPMSAAIPVRTERQAMDWSLVLVSQGIETTIERDAQADLWRLVVDAPDYSKALRTLRQYRVENRQQVWRQELPWTGLVFDWRSLAPLMVFVCLYLVEASGRFGLTGPGLMDNQLVHSGEWWRLFTAVTLHRDIAHLAMNVTTGLLLVGLAMGVYGPGIGLLASFLAGVGGNVAGFLLYPDHPEPHRSLGASGMVMGALGLLAAQWLTLLRHGLTPRQWAARGILGGCLLLVLLGFSPERNVDVLAHVGGFVTGLSLGAGLAFCPRTILHSEWMDRTALASAVILTGVSWWLALR